MNRRGTLDGLQDVFLNIMSEHTDALHKVMDIQLQMPSSEKSFSSMFTHRGFELLEEGVGEEAVHQPDPESLYHWLHDTGVIAGTGKIFRNSEQMKRVIIDRLAAHFASGDGYSIHHKYVYGVYARE